MNLQPKTEGDNEGKSYWYLTVLSYLLMMYHAWITEELRQCRGNGTEIAKTGLTAWNPAEEDCETLRQCLLGTWERENVQRMILIQKSAAQDRLKKTAIGGMKKAIK